MSAPVSRTRAFTLHQIAFLVMPRTLTEALSEIRIAQSWEKPAVLSDTYGAQHIVCATTELSIDSRALIYRTTAPTPADARLVKAGQHMQFASLAAFGSRRSPRVVVRQMTWCHGARTSSRQMHCLNHHSSESVDKDQGHKHIHTQ